MEPMISRSRALAITFLCSVSVASASGGKPSAASVHTSRATPTALARTAPRPPAAKQLTITVLWDDAMSTRDSGLWIGYLFARMEFISRNGGRYNRVPGVVNPIFDEEIFARTEAAKVYRELRSKGKGTDSAYFNDLDKVDAAGFMREYVWRYLHRDEWGVAPDALRVSEFDRWAKANLLSHAPETRGRIAFQDGAASG